MFRPNDAMQRSLSILRPGTIDPSSTSPCSRGSASSPSSFSSSTLDTNTVRRRTTTTTTNNHSKPLTKRSNHSQSQSHSHSRSRPPLAKQLSPVAQAKLQLLPKIAEFRQKGWITRQEEKEFIEILSEHKSNPFDGTVHSIQTILNNIQQDQLKQTQTNNKTLELKQQQQQQQITTTATGTILEPSDLQVRDENYLQELFCEMCFFARLGFVQPPSCLQCVYKESIQGIPADSNCARFVVWRKNARALLHPQQLEENIVLVECKAVRSLLEGKTVDAHQWDKERRQLLYHM